APLRSSSFRPVVPDRLDRRETFRQEALKRTTTSYLPDQVRQTDSRGSEGSRRDPSQWQQKARADHLRRDRSPPNSRGSLHSKKSKSRSASQSPDGYFGEVRRHQKNYAEDGSRHSAPRISP